MGNVTEISSGPKISNTALFVIVVGASGAGKTTVIKSLEKSFNHASFYYFDDIGIPDAYEMIKGHGSTERWQEWATHSWIERLYNRADHDNILVLEGSFYPEFAVAKMKELGIERYLVICLHADKTPREDRLTQRGQPELATDDMETYAQVLKQRTKELGGVVVDSSHKEIAELVNEIKELIVKAL